MLNILFKCLVYFTHLCNLHWFFAAVPTTSSTNSVSINLPEKIWLEARCLLLDTVWYLWWWVEYESLKDIITKHNGHLFNSLHLGARESPRSTSAPLEATALLLAVIPSQINVVFIQTCNIFRWYHMILISSLKLISVQSLSGHGLVDVAVLVFFFAGFLCSAPKSKGVASFFAIIVSRISSYYQCRMNCN